MAKANGFGANKKLKSLDNKNRLKQLLRGGALVAAIVLVTVLISVRNTSIIRENYQCYKCHSEYQDKMKMKFVHTGFQEEKCIGCHTKHGEEIVKEEWADYGNLLANFVFGKKLVGKKTLKSVEDGDRPKEKSKLVKVEKKLCEDCHEGEEFKIWKKSKFKHPPYKKGACTSCHDPHASKYSGVIRKEPRKLCPSCHNIKPWMSKKVLHPPFKKKNCADCHEPHASNVEQHLRVEQKKLCPSCHQNIAALFNLKYKMKPFEEGKCTKCHNPHSSNYKRLWQKGPKESDLCFSCHDGSNGQDVKKFANDPYKMKPYADGKCSECHKPHATKDPKLLIGRGNEFCYKCHGKYKKNYLPISHNKKAEFNKDSPNSSLHGKGSCLNCHVPHGSKHFGLIYKEAISLCTTCHRNYYKGEHIAHPVGQDIKDPWRGRYLRCPSCHNPMGSGISKLRRAKDDGLCIKCHNYDDPTWIKGRKKK